MLEQTSALQMKRLNPIKVNILKLAGIINTDFMAEKLSPTTGFLQVDSKEVRSYQDAKNLVRSYKNLVFIGVVLPVDFLYYMASRFGRHCKNATRKKNNVMANPLLIIKP